MSEDRPDRPFVAVSPPGASTAVGHAMGVAAPIGAVSTKDRERAARTSLEREGVGVVLRTALPGHVMVQRRGDDGTWETIEKMAASHAGRTPVELPGAAGATTFRVVFVPKNTDINAWVSEDLEA